MRGRLRYPVATLVGLATVICFGHATRLAAQDARSVPWGQLIPTEQYRDRLADDPTAGASVVFDRGLITVGPGFKFTFERRRRIQIFRTDAYRFANVEILYHKSEKIESIEAHTLTRDGRRVEVAKKQFYHTKTGDWNTLVFAFPDVSPGCVIEYRYKLASGNFYYLRPWAFQDEIPVEYSELGVRLPEGFEYAAVANNAGLISGPDTLEFLSLRHPDRKVRQFTWRAFNLAPLVSETCVPSLLDHRALLDFQIVRYRDGGHVWEFVDDWDDLVGQVKRIYSPLMRAGDDWPKWTALPEEASLAAKERAIARSVFRFVRDSVALTGGASSVYSGRLRSAREVLKQRRGNGIEKNLLFVAMLRDHGLSAWPVLISRRSHLRFDRRDHRLEQFDHTIALLDIDGEHVFCETNVPNAWLGYLPPDDQVEAGVVIGRSDQTVVDLPAPPVDRTVVVDATIDLRADGSARGHIEFWVAGQAAYELLCALADHDTLGYLREHWLPGIEPTAVTIIRDAGDEWAPYGVTVEFVWPEAAVVDGDRLFIRPSALGGHKGNPLMTARRRYPISFDTPWSEDFRVVWRVPAGFRINALPTARDLSGDGFEFRSSVTQDGDEIIASHFWEVNRRDFPVRRFEELREMFNSVELSEQGLVVLFRERH